VTIERTYRNFTHREAAFRICCEQFDAVTAEIVRQRRILEDYIKRHAAFANALKPIDLLDDAPRVAKRMARAAKLVGVGPMAAVAGAMAQCAAEAGIAAGAAEAGIAAGAAEAGIAAGAAEAIVENGGDIYLVTTQPVVIGLNSGTGELAGRLAFSLDADQTPISICSSSGTMGHSMSFGQCDLATVVARDAALADAAATMAANLVSKAEQIDATLENIAAIDGIDGVMIVKNDRVGLAGKLPRLVKTRS
jgi:ApbE superfamily uncharacterized protein (UPF0280 family)